MLQEDTQRQRDPVERQQGRRGAKGERGLPEEVRRIGVRAETRNDTKAVMSWQSGKLPLCLSQIPESAKNPTIMTVRMRS